MDLGAPTPLPSREATLLPDGYHIGSRATATRLGAAAHLMLRWSLALVFIWFGGLKVLGLSPVTDLLEATVPLPNPALTAKGLGIVELLLGAGLLWARRSSLVSLLLAAHLVETFLRFVMAPELTMNDSNPLILTTDGEFVLKNLVLVSAALVAAGTAPQPVRSRRRPG